MCGKKTCRTLGCIFCLLLPHPLDIGILSLEETLVSRRGCALSIVLSGCFEGKEAILPVLGKLGQRRTAGTETGSCLRFQSNSRQGWATPADTRETGSSAHLKK